MERWRGVWGAARGAVLTPPQTLSLAHAWYDQDRRDPSWRRHTKEETEAVFMRLGLVGPFWEVG